MNSGKLSNSYKLEFRLLKQKYEIWMEDPEVKIFFYKHKILKILSKKIISNEKNMILKK